MLDDEVWDGSWAFDRSMYVVCNRRYDEPLVKLARQEWAERNRFYRARGQPTLIESVPRTPTKI